MAYFLTIDGDLSVTPNPAPAHATVTLTFTVKNTGDAKATASDDEFMQGVYVGYRYTNNYGRSVEESAILVPPLDPGASSTHSVSSSFGGPGAFGITVEADPVEPYGGASGNGNGGKAVSALVVI